MMRKPGDRVMIKKLSVYMPCVIPQMIQYSGRTATIRGYAPCGGYFLDIDNSDFKSTTYVWTDELFR